MKSEFGCIHNSIVLKCSKNEKHGFQKYFVGFFAGLGRIIAPPPFSAFISLTVRITILADLANVNTKLY